MLQQMMRRRIYRQLDGRIQNRKFEKADAGLKMSAAEYRLLFNDEPHTLYLHFPFCDIACKFCRFGKSVNHDLTTSYCESLLREIDMVAEIAGKKLSLSSVYLGGGTPSLIPQEYLKKIISKIREVFDCKPAMQITIECHPHSINESSTTAFTNAGINRLSIGVQSFMPEVLQEMGRPFDAAYITQLLQSFKDQQFSNYNVDLIYGFKSHNQETFLIDLKKAIDFGAGHITLFPLIKPLKLETPDDLIRQREMYEGARKLLSNHGYHQYSVEDFTLNEVHKIDYQVDAWSVPSRDLILLGTNGFGNLSGHFYQKEKSIKKYISQISENKWPVATMKKLDEKHEHFRRLIFGLHYIGVDRATYMEKYGVDIVKEWRWPMKLMQLSGILKVTKGRIELAEGEWFDASKLWGRALFSML